jgi:Arc/MetJ-type ribon-helix-helix transcriptional regulator
MRALVDLPPEQVEALAEIGRRERVSRAALVREAVEDLIAKRRRDNLKAAFGLWKDRPDIKDGLEYQDGIRAEWDHRP